MIAQLNKAYILARPTKIFPRLLSYFLYEGRPATTKGRWFNPITFRSLRSAAHTSPVQNSESPVFITGTGRSGSTILGMVLSMHRDVGFLNEPKALWYVANPSDDLIGSYSTGHADYIMNASHATNGTANHVKAMYSSFLNRSRTKCIVDKFPEMIFRVEFLNQIFENPKYLFLYRNPWEMINSTSEWSKKHTDIARHEDWWGVNDRKWNLLLEQVVPKDDLLSLHIAVISEMKSQQDKAAVEWIVTMNYGLKMLEKYPEKVLPVKFEELCKNTETTLQQICDFTDLKRDSVFIKFGKTTIREGTVKKAPHIHPVLLDAISELSFKLGYQAHSPEMSVTE